MKPAPLAVLGAALVLSTVAPATVAPAQAAAARDPIAAALADPSRSAQDRAQDEARKPAAVLGFLALKPGQVVADWGAGYYAVMLADLVGPKGTVYAVVNGNRWKPAEWQGALATHPALRMVAVPPQARQFPPASLDVIFANLEYHDLYWESAKYDYPRRNVPAVLANWFAALRPGGSVVIIDHAGPAGDPRAIADSLHRIDPARVRADMIAAGFVPDGESDALRHPEDPHTGVVFDPAMRGRTDRFVVRFRRP